MEIRRTLATEIGHVGPGAAKLEEILAAGQIVQPAARHFKPGVRPVHVDAMLAQRHPGLHVQPGLMHVAVKNEPVDTQTVHQIPERLHRIGIILP